MNLRLERDGRVLRIAGTDDLGGLFALTFDTDDHEQFFKLANLAVDVENFLVGRAVLPMPLNWEFPAQPCHVCRELVDQADARIVHTQDGMFVGWYHAECRPDA